MTRSILLATHEFQPYPGGVGRYCTALANAAANVGFEVDVVAPDHGESLTPAMHPRCRLYRFPGGQFSMGGLGAYRQLIAKRLKERRYGIIHAADSPAILAARALVAPGAVRIATVFGTDVLMFRKSLRWRLAGAGRSLAAFEQIASISAFTHGLLVQHYPKLGARSRIVPLGVDSRWFGPADSTALGQLRAQCGLGDGQRLVLSVARIDRRKGQDLTIKALANLPADLRGRIRYLCIGREVEADYTDSLRSLAAELSVNLTLAGQLPDEQVHAAYHSADVLAHTAAPQPDRVEGFGLVLLEAAAAGLPAVVTPVDAIPEVVVSGRTGYVARTPEQLGIAFRNILDGDRETWRTACVEHARRYDWDACVRGTYGSL